MGLREWHRRCGMSHPVGKSKPHLHHVVYIVFLRNPKGEGKAGYYVGMTGLTARERKLSALLVASASCCARRLPATRRSTVPHISCHERQCATLLRQALKRIRRRRTHCTIATSPRCVTRTFVTSCFGTPEPVRLASMMRDLTPVRHCVRPVDDSCGQTDPLQGRN